VERRFDVGRRRAGVGVRIRPVGGFGVAQQALGLGVDGVDGVGRRDPGDAGRFRGHEAVTVTAS